MTLGQKPEIYNETTKQTTPIKNDKGTFTIDLWVHKNQEWEKRRTRKPVRNAIEQSTMNKLRNAKPWSSAPVRRANQVFRRQR